MSRKTTGIPRKVKCDKCDKGWIIVNEYEDGYYHKTKYYVCQTCNGTGELIITKKDKKCV